jgi:cobalt-zinc-cadmium efflux system membrane fusion protein
VEITAPATVEMNPSLVSKVMMPVAGRVRQLLVGLGDAVRRGQVVLTLESPEVGAALTAYRQAEASLAQARAGVAKAEVDLLRTRDLYAHRAIAQKEVLSAETVVVQAKAVQDQAHASLEDARRRLQILGLAIGTVDQLVCVSAPVNGKVIEISVTAGEYRNDTSSPVMTIADLSTVWVAADVPESAVRFVKVGEYLDTTFDAFPGQTFSARVMRIADLLDPQTRTIKVRAQLDNPHERLHPQMFAKVQLHRGMKAMPVVPCSAVLRTERRNSVFLERGIGEFEQITVAIAWERHGRCALSSGPKRGDRVVVEGVMLLKGSEGDWH